jgi:hypothetical protein
MGGPLAHDPVAGVKTSTDENTAPAPAVNWAPPVTTTRWSLNTLAV